MSQPSYAAGSRIKLSATDHLEIMAVAKGYFMCRRKGCIPFTVSVKELPKRIEQMKKYSALTEL